ncbi:unnamed protein product [Oikopleura dioica]|uniref:BSD domain-containing protein n=1 Tax=Oikopleura dioica TaxID=34765 RepID=E4YJ61_OIKDI|nr:unnamed protein product [Oikopleura dioica]
MSDEKVTENEENSGWGGWASWATNAVTSAVEKVNNVAEESINAISDASEFMQRDLEEFAKVVKEDSTAILTAATEASYQSINHYAGEEIAKETASYTKAGVSILGSGLRTLVVGVEKVLLESDHESEDENQKSEIQSKNLLPENKSNTNLEEPVYETNPQTYLRDPMDPNFDNWKVNFNKTIESRKNKLTEILIARTNVRLMYNKLVPKKANHNDFWARYLYRLELEGLVPDTEHVHAPDELELSTASMSALSETDKQESSSPESEPLEVVKKDEIKKIADSDEGDMDDWEKDLDLDITEEEMNKALAEVDDDWDLEEA